MTAQIMGSLVDKFWPKVNKNGPVVRPDLGPCWVWTATRNRRGYGHLVVRAESGPRARKVWKAHRLSWFIHSGTVPVLHVCHKCDNPPCVNPGHLFLGTQKDNMEDCASKGRLHGDTSEALRVRLEKMASRTHCRRGHALDETNLYSPRPGVRICKACKRGWRLRHPRGTLTRAEAARRATAASAARMKSRTHCKNGHEYTPANTYIATTSTGTARNCRKCHCARELQRQRRLAESR